MALEEAIVYVKQQDLLSSIWYPDGSGARGDLVGIASPSDGWRIKLVEVAEDENGQKTEVKLVLEAVDGS